jgi:phage gpG-like protein
VTALFEINAKLEGMEVVDRALGALDPIDGAELMNGIGRMVQEQTRRRITSEKTAPSGEAWKANRAGTSILYASAALARSVDYSASADETIVGSGLVYAGIQHHGGTIVPKKAKRLVFRVGNRTVFARKVTIPPRPYLGLSAENAEDVVDQIARFLRSKIGGR